MPAELPGDQPVAAFVGGEFCEPEDPASPESRVLSLQSPVAVQRLCIRAVPPATMPETAVHKDRHALLGEDKVRSNHCFATLDLGFWTPDCEAQLRLPPPPGNANSPEKFRQRQFRILVAVPANPRHHLGAFALPVICAEMIVVFVNHRTVSQNSDRPDILFDRHRILEFSLSSKEL